MVASTLDVASWRRVLSFVAVISVALTGSLVLAGSGWGHSTLGGLFVTILLILAGCIIKRDIIRRAKAREAFQQSEERFRLLVESAKDYAILMLDPKGHITSWNPGAERIKGYRAGEIIGKHFSCFYPPEDIARGKPEEELKIVREKGQYEEDGWRVRKNGSRFWANVSLTRLLDREGRLVGFSKITRDLSERRRAEEEIHSFFTLSLDLLCIAGADGYFKRLNPMWEKTLGFTNMELRAAPYLDFVHPEDRAATVVEAEKLATGIPLIHFENRYRCKDGSYRWMTWKSAVSFDRRLFYASARDITDQKLAEHEIAELNKTLRRGNAELEIANKELEAFSYSVSHDLRAPLRSLDGFSQVLLEDYGSKLDEEGQSHLSRIRAASQRMGLLIDDLLNLSRFSRMEMRRSRVDLSAMAREVVEEFHRLEPGRQVEFVIADGLFVDADPRLLRVVLDNLLGNAWKFTGKRAKACIEVGCSQEKGVKIYFVRDDGAGFDMNFSKRLFGPFQRLHAMEEFPGTGIGLATVQRIINRHGGRIWAKGEVEAGATFNFTL